MWMCGKRLLRNFNIGYIRFIIIYIKKFLLLFTVLVFPSDSASTHYFILFIYILAVFYFSIGNTLKTIFDFWFLTHLHELFLQNTRFSVIVSTYLRSIIEKCVTLCLEFNQSHHICFCLWS